MRSPCSPARSTRPHRTPDSSPTSWPGAIAKHRPWRGKRTGAVSGRRGVWLGVSRSVLRPASWIAACLFRSAGPGERIPMKACGVSGADGDVVLLELPDPPSPGPGQILVAVEAAGVGPWDRLLNGGGWDVGLRPPAALGVEGAGRVLAVGADVGEFAVGDRVLAHAAPLPGASGFWAERVLLTASHAASRPSELASV